MAATPDLLSVPTVLGLRRVADTSGTEAYKDHSHGKWKPHRNNADISGGEASEKNSQPITIHERMALSAIRKSGTAAGRSVSQIVARHPAPGVIYTKTFANNGVFVCRLTTFSTRLHSNYLPLCGGLTRV
jgi:hypothetical protein